MRSMKRNLRLYVLYVSAVLRSSMQYKLSFVLMAIGRFLVAFNGLLGLMFLFSGFQGLKDYSYGDVLLCFAIMQMGFYISECVGTGFKTFSGMVRRGEFDRILLRPCSAVLQVLGSRFELGRLGMLASALVTLVWGIRKSEINWNVARVFTLFAMVFGGMLLFIGLFMVEAAVCFFFIEGAGSMNILTYGANEHGKYPIDIYGKGLMRFCTYVIPYTLVQYYPLQFLLGKSDKMIYGLYPFGIVGFFTVCYIFWRFGVRHYKSCGS